MREKAIIKRIYWDKAYLMIAYTSPEPLDWWILNIDNGERVSFVPFESPKNSDEYLVGLFVCEANGDRMIPRGSWILECDNDNQGYSFVDEAMMEVPELTHAFLYTDKNSAYIVGLSFHKDDIEHLYITTRFMKDNPHPEKRAAKKNIIKFLVDGAYKLFRAFKPSGKKGILLLSETRSEMSDNFMALYNRMMELEMDKDYNISVQMVNEMDDTKSKFHKLNVVKKIAANDYIFVDDYVPILTVFDPAPEVKLIQLWHAGFGYKLVGYGRFGRSGTPHPFQSCHRKYTYGVVGNEALKETYREVFGIPKERLIATGMPRLEHFLDEEVIGETKKNILETYPQFAGKRLILFAPTYRGMNQQTAVYEYDRIDFRELYHMCEATDSMVIFKMHHFIKDSVPIPEAYKDRLIDLTGESLNDLMYVADVLITDYSSCFYDYVLLDRPIIFYIYDEAEYTATRGVHKPVAETAPGIICHTWDELINTLNMKEIPKVEPADYMVDNCKINGDLGATDRILAEVFGEDILQKGGEKVE